MPLTIKTHFSVPQPPDVVWPTLLDIETSAPCFPGTQLKERLPDGRFAGVFSVKLGPMTFAFSGKFRIVEQDDTARTALIEADGTDTKGRGGANAQVRLVLLPGADDSSDISVVSDVTLSGGVAQYGRGVSMIEALSKQLLEQFSKNLTGKIAAMPPPAVQPSYAAPTPRATTPVASKDEESHVATPAPLAGEPAAPLDAGALMRGAMWLSIRRFFARLFGSRR